MRVRSGRRGVASVVGTVVFILVFMLALGSLAYASGLQAQASQAEEQAQTVVALKGGESLTFGGAGSAVQAVNGGPGTVDVNHVVLQFPNGTVYALAAVAVLPSGGEVGVSQLIPSMVCAPGTATCLSKYDSIVTGGAPGGSVGVVTDLGNVFWYTGAGVASGWTQVTITSSGNWTVPSGVVGAYVVCIGGGGGGGGSGAATYVSGADGGGGGGGGGVGSLAQGFVNLGGAGSVTVTVGQGGQGGSSGSAQGNGGPGRNGGQSSFGRFIACGGGGGGGGALSTSNGAGGSYCYTQGTTGGGGAGVPGGGPTLSGVPSDAFQETIYGGGGGGGGSFYYPAGAGSPSDSMDSGTVFTSVPGASGQCAFGGGGGSASPFANGGAGGPGATTCSSGGPGVGAVANSGAGGGGGGGSYATNAACGTRAGAAGGAGGSGLVIVNYQG